MVPHPSHSRAAAVLQAGGIVAHYTDTIVGFACLPKPNLLQRLNRIKLRKNKQGFILLATGVDQLDLYIDCTPSERNTLIAPLDKPTTWIVNATSCVPTELKNQHNQLAIRVTQDKNVSEVTRHTGAIVSTSANLTGNTPCAAPEQVRQQFSSQVDYIIRSDNFGSGQASTIIDIHTHKVLRP